MLLIAPHFYTESNVSKGSFPPAGEAQGVSLIDCPEIGVCPGVSALDLANLR